MSEVASADSGQGSPVSTSAALAAPAASAAPAAPTGSQLTVSAAPTDLPAMPSLDWAKGADETTTGYIQNKGWDSPMKVVDSYRNLEKLLGADKANNAVIIPKHDADPKEWAAVYDKLGRPSAPDGYKVALPENGDKTMHEASLAKFHELGLTKTQGEQLANWYNNQVAEGLKASETERAARFQQEDTAVRQEWGAAFTQNLAQAQAAARGLGLDAATIDKLSDALGHKGTMDLLYKIGSRMGEDNFVTGDNSTAFGSAMTPAQAKAQIQSMMGDKDFVAKYLKGDGGAKAEMARLHQFAYPDA